MVFLVTGAAGFIGSNLALKLQGIGKIFGFDDLSCGTKDNLDGFKEEFISEDIRTLDYSKVGKKVDAIFHQAAITDTTIADGALMDSVNVDAFKRILIFAKKIGCKKVVYASSAAVYGKGKVPMSESNTPTPTNIYGESKVKMEAVARQFQKESPDFSIVGLRYFNVYGPREVHKEKAASMVYQLYLQIAQNRNPRIFKWGEQFRDFIYVVDVVEANLKALEYSKSGVFNVGTGTPQTFNRLIEVLNAALGKDLKPEYFDNPHRFYQDETQADTNLSSSELKFNAKYELEGGVRDYIKIIKRHRREINVKAQ